MLAEVVKVPSNKSEDQPTVDRSEFGSFLSDIAYCSKRPSQNGLTDQTQFVRDAIVEVIKLKNPGDTDQEIGEMANTWHNNFLEVFIPDEVTYRSYELSCGEELINGEYMDNGARIVDMVFEREGTVYRRLISIPANKWLRDRGSNGSEPTLSLAEVTFIDFVIEAGPDIHADLADDYLGNAANGEVGFGPEFEYFLTCSGSQGTTVHPLARVELGESQREVSTYGAGFTKLIGNTVSLISDLVGNLPEGIYIDMGSAPASLGSLQEQKLNSVSEYVKVIAAQLEHIKVSPFYDEIHPDIKVALDELASLSSDDNGNSFNSVEDYVRARGILIWMLNSFHGNIGLIHDDRGGVFPEEIIGESNLYSYFGSILGAATHSCGRPFGSQDFGIGDEEVCDARSGGINTLFQSATPSLIVEPEHYDVAEVMKASILSGHANILDRAGALVTTKNGSEHYTVATATHGDYRPRAGSLYAHMVDPKMVIQSIRSEYTGRSASPDLLHAMESYGLQLAISYANKIAFKEGADVVGWMRSEEGHSEWGQSFYSENTSEIMWERMEAGKGRFARGKVDELSALIGRVEKYFEDNYGAGAIGHEFGFAKKFLERIREYANGDSAETISNWNGMIPAVRFLEYINKPDESPYYSFGHFAMSFNFAEMESAVSGYLEDKELRWQYEEKDIPAVFNHIVLVERVRQLGEWHKNQAEAEAEAAA